MAFLVFAVPLLLGAVVLLLRKVGARERGLPPGPPTLPVLGNLHIFPKEFGHYKCVLLSVFSQPSLKSLGRFTEWAREYGGIYSASLP